MLFLSSFDQRINKNAYLCIAFENSKLFRSYVVKAKQNGQVLHDQLPRNPPGRERSKGTWL